MDDLERYIERHVTPEDPLLAELDRETHLRVVQPRMISGHLQGRLLEMVVRMIRPQRILEIGTFTGYSAICMARGLDEGGELHTIEANDELEPIASKYFIRSGLSGRITLHIGSALDIAPSLGVFDLIFIDGDKREYPQYYDMALSHLVRSGSYLLVRESGRNRTCRRPAYMGDPRVQRPGIAGRPRGKRDPADPRRVESDPGKIAKRTGP